MKKKDSIAKFSVKKNTVAKLNYHKLVSVVGGAVSGSDYQACNPPKSREYDSCYSPCGSANGTRGCVN